MYESRGKEPTQDSPKESKRRACPPTLGSLLPFHLFSFGVFLSRAVAEPFTECLVRQKDWAGKEEGVQKNEKRERDLRRAKVQGGPSFESLHSHVRVHAYGPRVRENIIQVLALVGRPMCAPRKIRTCCEGSNPSQLLYYFQYAKTSWGEKSNGYNVALHELRLGQVLKAFRPSRKKQCHGNANVPSIDDSDEIRPIFICNRSKVEF